MNIKKELILGALSVLLIIGLSVGAVSYYQSTNKRVTPNTGQGSTADKKAPTYTPDEVAKHNSQNDCWLIIENKVYDVTDYLVQHPGGAKRIIPFCGQDATQAFMTKGGEGQHSSEATAELAKRYKGDLSAATSSSSTNKTIDQTKTNGNSTESQGASLTMAEVAKHASQNDCYLVISGKVYDVTSYISQHPGGAQRIINFCGQEATQAFMTKGGQGSHSSAATQALTTLYIGDLNQSQVKQVDTKAVQSLPVSREREDDDND